MFLPYCTVLVFFHFSFSGIHVFHNSAPGHGQSVMLFRIQNRPCVIAVSSQAHIEVKWSLVMFLNTQTAPRFDFLVQEAGCRVSTPTFWWRSQRDPRHGQPRAAKQVLLLLKRLILEALFVFCVRDFQDGLLKCTVCPVICWDICVESVYCSQCSLSWDLLCPQA